MDGGCRRDGRGAENAPAVLVDQLDEDAAREALARLQDLRLPRFVREAPVDDEPETDEERAAVAEAETDVAAGRMVAHDATAVSSASSEMGTQLDQSRTHDLRQLDRQTAQRVVRALDRLAATDQADVTRLQGDDPPQWRPRVGDWRVRFRFRFDREAGELVILRVLPRGRAYRD